jgi:hypothetical protein
MKNGSCQQLLLLEAPPFPLVIPTGGVMGLRPAQGDEKRVLFSKYFRRKRDPVLCHLDRSSEGA